MADWDHATRLASLPSEVPKSGIVMGKELVVAEAAEEQAADEAGAQDADSYIDVEIIEEDGLGADALLDEADAAALEEGIASVFGTLRAETEGSDEADAADSTFALLEELNRLWAQATPA